jgi:hypothetical protein
MAIHYMQSCKLSRLRWLAIYAGCGDWQNAYIYYAGYVEWLTILAMLVCLVFWLY